MPQPKDRGQTQQFRTDIPDAAVAFDQDAFDNLIRAHGVTFQHFRAMRCPVGLSDKYDLRRTHDDHSGCSNGFIYTLAGSITCLFTGNGTQVHVNEMGILDGSSVSVSLPRFYDGTENPVYIAAFDRLYLAEEAIAVVNWQLFEASPTGKDKLHFPVIAVQDLIDSNNERYTSADFQIDKGMLVWQGSHRPGVDPTSRKGLICAVRYTYRPYWYVKQLVHEVRVAQVENPVTGDRVVQRMPQAALLQREYVFEKEDRDAQAVNPESPRQVPAPGNAPWAGLR